jgi:hypothetical protein
MGLGSTIDVNGDRQVSSRKQNGGGRANGPYLARHLVVTTMGISNRYAAPSTGLLGAGTVRRGARLAASLVRVAWVFAEYYEFRHDF